MQHLIMALVEAQCLIHQIAKDSQDFKDPMCFELFWVAF